MLTVGKRPIIDYIIDKLQTIDEINEIVVVTNSKFISIFRKWASSLGVKKPISLVDDLTKDHSDRRGAIGDMNFVINKKRIKDDLLVIGADNLFDGDLRDFIFFAKANKPNAVMGAYNIRNKEKAKKYGVIKLSRNNKIIDFKEKPENPDSTLVAMCLYYFPKEKLRLIKEYFNTNIHKCDATGFYIDWLRKKEPVFGFVFEGFWYDIGHPKTYKEAKKEYANV